MTNNPTIDGVSRKTIERIADHCKFWKDHAYIEAIGDIEPELRALLDAPVVERQPLYQVAARLDSTKSAWIDVDKESFDDYAGRGDSWITRVLYVAQPELAALQSTIAQLQARIGELESGRGELFQSRVQPWMIDCFGPVIAGDQEERNHRFLEEALELVQACGASASEAHQLVDYVYGRPVGEPAQEVGGVMVTLAALCLANGLEMHANGETELARIWTKVDQIRAKQAAKPAMSPLPGAYPDRAPPAPDAAQDQDIIHDAAFRNGVMHGYRPGTEGSEDEYQKCISRLTDGLNAARRERRTACLDATAALNGPAK